MLVYIGDYTFTKYSILRTGMYASKMEVQEAIEYKLSNGVSLTLPASVKVPDELPLLFNECLGTENLPDLAYLYGLLYCASYALGDTVTIVIPPNTDIAQLIRFLKHVFKKYIGEVPTIYQDSVQDMPVIRIQDAIHALEKIKFSHSMLPDVILSFDQDATYTFIYMLLSRAKLTKANVTLSFSNPKLAFEIAMLFAKLGMNFKYESDSVHLSSRDYDLISTNPNELVIKQAHPVTVVERINVGLKPFVNMLGVVGINGIKARCLYETA